MLLTYAAACGRMWQEAAAENAGIYRDVFGVVPCNNVRTRLDFEKRMEANRSRSLVYLASPQSQPLSQFVGRVVQVERERARAHERERELLS